MLLARFRQCTEVYLGQSVLGLQQDDQKVVWQEVDGIAQALDRLDQWLSNIERPHIRLRVWLSGACARPFVVDQATGARTHQERESIAEILVSQAACFSSKTKIWLDTSPLQASCLCVAVEASLLERLSTLSMKHRVRLVSVRPWWNLVLDTLRGEGSDSKQREGQSNWFNHFAESVVTFLCSAFKDYPGKSPVANVAPHRIWSLTEPDAVTLMIEKDGHVAHAETHEPSASDPGCILSIRRSLAIKGFEEKVSQHWLWNRASTLIHEDAADSFLFPIGSISRQMSVMSLHTHSS